MPREGGSGATLTHEATEELVAELGSCFVCASFGFSWQKAQSPAYLGQLAESTEGGQPQDLLDRVLRLRLTRKKLAATDLAEEPFITREVGSGIVRFHAIDRLSCCNKPY